MNEKTVNLSGVLFCRCFSLFDFFPSHSVSLSLALFCHSIGWICDTEWIYMDRKTVELWHINMKWPHMTRFWSLAERARIRKEAKNIHKNMLTLSWDKEKVYFLLSSCDCVQNIFDGAVFFFFEIFSTFSTVSIGMRWTIGVGQWPVDNIQSKMVDQKCTNT